MNHCLQAKKVSLTQAFSFFDKDQNYLISAEEIAPFCRDFMDVAIDETHIGQVRDLFKTRFMRTEITKKELTQLLMETPHPREFSSPDA